MFCQNCGHQLKENAKFCQNCGERLVVNEVIEDSDITIENEEIAVKEIEENPASEKATESEKIQEDNSAVKKSSDGLKTGCLGFLALLLPAIGLLTLPIVLKIIIFIVAVIVIICKFRKEPKKMWAWIAILVGITLMMTMVSCSIGCVKNLANLDMSDYYIDIVKTSTLEAYPQMTVGEAFDNYLENAQWESGTTSDGRVFVNVSGGVIYDGEEAEAVVQFVFEENSDYFRYYALEIDGVPQDDFWAGLFINDVFNERTMLE